MREPATPADGATGEGERSPAGDRERLPTGERDRPPTGDADRVPTGDRDRAPVGAGRGRPTGGGRRVDVEVAHPEVVTAVAARLEAAGVHSPRADARWLVTHVVGVAGDPAGGPGAALLVELVGRRAAREPLQLVVGTTAFRTVELVCRPGVFIPRPETEVVAGVAIEAARAAGPAPVVVEPCTGTGAIACSLVAEVPGVRVVATDRDPAATALARENLARVTAGAAGVAGAAPGAVWEVLDGDLLGPVDRALRGRLDVLVANPPYLPAADRGGWEPEVADHDPEAALVGGRGRARGGRRAARCRGRLARPGWDRRDRDRRAAGSRRSRGGHPRRAGRGPGGPRPDRCGPCGHGPATGVAWSPPGA
jgi:release factor glutamine methyltransferase